MSPNPKFPADFVTFTKKNLNRKLHFCSVLVPLISKQIKTRDMHAGLCQKQAIADV